MNQIIKEERTSFNSNLSDSNDSQNINGSIKEKQNSLEDEEEYNKEEIIELFNEFGQINKKKKVSFLNDKNLVTIIEVESYKKFNYLNAYEDPYEDALSMFGNINLLNEEDEEDENTRLNCACFIF